MNDVSFFGRLDGQAVEEHLEESGGGGGTVGLWAGVDPVSLFRDIFFLLSRNNVQGSFE